MAEELIVVLDEANKFYFVTMIGKTGGMIVEADSGLLKQLKGDFPGGGVKISSIKQGDKPLTIKSQNLQRGNVIYTVYSKEKGEQPKCVIKSAFLKFA